MPLSWHRVSQGGYQMKKAEDRKAQEEAKDRIDIEEARAALKEAEEQGIVSWEKIKADLNL
jgi:hypothetical protein